MEPHLQARMLFPSMPEEIFNLWFDDRINVNGWPPHGGLWRGALCRRPIGFWKELEWTKKTLHLQFNKFTQFSKTIITSLILAYFLGAPNSLSLDLGDASKHRLQDIRSCLEANGIFPNPIILLQEGDRFEIADGCHRLAVFSYLRHYTVPNHPLQEAQLAWVGAPPEMTDIAS